MNYEDFWDRVRAELKGHPHGVMISELSVKLESAEDTRESVYARLNSRARSSAAKTGRPALFKGLGFYRVPKSSYRIFSPDEPFVPPTSAEHQRERVRNLQVDRRVEMKGATGGLSRVPVSRASYEPPRRRVPVCKLCCNLPHARPQPGCPMCGRPRIPEPKPVAPERCFDRVVVP